MTGGKGVKIKGSSWERGAVKLLNNLIRESNWRRIPSSGAIGTILSEPLLGGDITGTVKGFPRTFRGEAKIGYGGAKQFTLKKEWIDKIAREAYNTYSLPFLIGRFSGARDGNAEFIVLDIMTFTDILNEITKLYEELEKNGVGRD